MSLAGASDGRRWIDVCSGDALVDGGDGVRFACDDPRARGAEVGAFVIRHRGRAQAFVNRCAHQAVELDWLPGRFFDADGLYLVCSMHGAEFEADTGRCVAGPCRGAALTALPCEERDGRVFVAHPVVASSHAPFPERDDERTDPAA